MESKQWFSPTQRKWWVEIMAERANWPLGADIPVNSIAHKGAALVTVTMDNSAWTYAEPDYDWVGTYGVHDLSVVPSPAPYFGHKGTDIAKGRGSAIYAITGGTVTQAGGTYNEIYINTGEYTDCYLHMEIGYVSIGEKVEAGQQIGTESGVGSSGSYTYGSHLHLDRFVTSKGRGAGTIDSFKYAIGEASGSGKEETMMLIDNISTWNPNNGKVGIWIGGSVRVKEEAPIYSGQASKQMLMQQANGIDTSLHVWKTECGASMEVVAGYLFANRVQVGVYDQLGAFHPRAWVNITDINW